MTKYIKITNTADKVNRVALEKLGLSTKRNDPNTIGMFGSGIKFAPIAALRNGWEWWFVGTDETGPYRMRYAKVMEEGVECVAYDYGDYTKSSSFTVDAGGLSWVDPFQIYREAVANAMDGAMQNDGTWSVDIVDSVDQAKPNEFSVYMSAAPELMDVVYNSDKFFSKDRDVLASYGKVKIYRKIDKSFRVYSHGVLVHENSELDSLFDYEVTPIELNEERTIKSMWSLRYEVYNALMNSDYSIASIVLSSLLKSSKTFESEVFSWNTSDGATTKYADHFAKMFGDHSVIVPDRMMNSFSHEIRLRGKNAVSVADDRYKIVANLGIPTLSSALGEEVNYKTIKDLDRFPNLVRAMEIVEKYEPNFSAYKDTLLVFDDPNSSVWGLCLNTHKPQSERTIMIEKSFAETGTMQQLIGTLIHELDHAMTGIKDANDDDGRKFRDVADTHIGNLVFDKYGLNPFVIIEDTLAFDPTWSGRVGMKFTIAYSPVMEATLVSTGRVKLLVDCSNVEVQEQVVIATYSEFDDRSMFTIPELGTVRGFKVV